MKSLKMVMDCIGVDTNNNVSVLQNLFGFTRDRVPPEQDPSVRASVSVLQQIQDLQQQHLHLNIVRVGFDTLPAADLTEGFRRLDYAIYRIRNIYRSVSLGIGRIQHWEILAADANGYDDLGSEDEAEELYEEWSIPNNGIDVFVVRNISDTDFIGISPVGGSCTKNNNNDGLIGGEINRDFEGFSRTFAHEIGHYLGLSHNHGDDCPTSTEAQNNLMAQTRCAVSTRDSVLLTTDQGQDMCDHCSAQTACE